MKKIFESLLDLIYRKKCYICGNSKYSLKICPNCFEKLEFNDFSPNRIIDGVNIYCAGRYNKELQKIIRGLKYHKQKDLAFYQAKFMYNYFLNLNINSKEFELIPVPLHQNRIKKRKYNHMELVCQEFSVMSGFNCNFNLVKRIKDTKPQYNLTKKERIQNLSNAFLIQKENLSNKNILIIDDICTTGATFEEMIKALKACGVNDITCFSTSTPL